MTTVVSPSHPCPGCGETDWHERHADSFACVSCDSIVHRCGPSFPWEFVGRKVRQRADAAMADASDPFKGSEWR